MVMALRSAGGFRLAVRVVRRGFLFALRDFGSERASDLLSVCDSEGGSVEGSEGISAAASVGWLLTCLGAGASAVPFEALAGLEFLGSFSAGRLDARVR